MPFVFLGRLFRRAVTSEYSSMATSQSKFCDQKQSFSVHFLLMFVILFKIEAVSKKPMLSWDTCFRGFQGRCNAIKTFRPLLPRLQHHQRFHSPGLRVLQQQKQWLNLIFETANVPICPNLFPISPLSTDPSLSPRQTSVVCFCLCLCQSNN